MDSINGKYNIIIHPVRIIFKYLTYNIKRLQVHDIYYLILNYF